MCTSLLGYVVVFNMSAALSLVIPDFTAVSDWASDSEKQRLQ